MGGHQWKWEEHHELVVISAGAGVLGGGDVHRFQDEPTDPARDWGGPLVEIEESGALTSVVQELVGNGGHLSDHLVPGVRAPFERGSLLFALQFEVPFDQEPHVAQDRSC